jgi:hypothetical protein
LQSNHKSLMPTSQHIPYQLILFDMDGVLLEPRGYHTALQASVKRIGQALGVPQAELTEDQIARFEALNITNEWDSVAICAAIILIYIWQFEPHLRLDGIRPSPHIISNRKLNFDNFLEALQDGGEVPGETAHAFILDHHPWLDEDQRAHLWTILSQCRDIYQSLTLPSHQETVLGSEPFMIIIVYHPNLIHTATYQSMTDLS